MKIGILGGSFDPLHLGHLAMAEEAQRSHALDRVIFIPAAQSPHKKGATIASSDIRLEMLRESTKHNPFFQVSDLEVKRKGASYTFDTLTELKKKFPEDTQFYLIVGADSLKDFETWHEWKKIMQLAKIVVAPRQKVEVKPWPAYALKLPMNPIDISSTEIRKTVSKGESISDWVPPAVREMIQDHHLYGSKS